MAIAGGLRAKFALDISSFMAGLEKAKKEYDRRAKRAITKGTLLYEREVKKELSKAGTGRARKIKGAKGTRRAGVTETGKARFRTVSGSNRASAPGEPPAVDTGLLRASITHLIEKEFFAWVGKVGTNVEYAAILEFGGYAGRNKSTFIAARPYMLITLTRIRRQLIRLFERELSG